MFLCIMDFKAVFLHVSKNRLTNKMKKFEIPDYLIELDGKQESSTDNSRRGGLREV